MKIEVVEEKFFVYVLKSSIEGRLYKGLTTNVERRVKEHNSGKMKSTKGYMPWLLFFVEECENRSKAREREKFLKSGAGREFLKQNFIQAR